MKIRFLSLMFLLTITALSACLPTTGSAPLPTLMPTAALPTVAVATPVVVEVTATSEVVVPPTFTPEAADTTANDESVTTDASPTPTEAPLVIVVYPTIEPTDEATAPNDELSDELTVNDITTNVNNFVLYEHPSLGFQLQHPPELLASDFGGLGASFILNGTFRFSTSEGIYDSTSIYVLVLGEMFAEQTPEIDFNDPVAFLENLLAEDYLETMEPEQVSVVDGVTAITINGYPAAQANIDIKPIPGADFVQRRFAYTIVSYEGQIISIQGDVDLAEVDIFMPIFNEVINTLELK